MPATSELPTVSVLIPCRNERHFIGPCLDSIVNNTYPKDRVEVLVIDGISEDGTRVVVADYVERFPFVRLVDNPKKITPAALNIGISQARGDILIRMDAHTTYTTDYISQCVRALENSRADCVGGIWRTIPREETLIAHGIVQCLSHPFGVGNSQFRLARARAPRWVDTVPFFCCRKSLFEQIGGFNEDLTRGQDMEFSLRIQRAGGRILLDPAIVSFYHARTDWNAFVRHNWINGVWAILPFAYSSVMPVSWRHLVPLVFVTSLMVSTVIGVARGEGEWLLACIVGSYGVVNLAASVDIAWRERDYRYAFVMPIIFASLHVTYGLGSLWGVVRLLTKKELYLKLLGRKASYAAVGLGHKKTS